MVKQQRHRLIVNVLSNYGTLVLYSVAHFILVGYIVRKLGSEAFGLVMLLISLTSMTELLGRGVSYALTKHLSEAITKKESHLSNEYINTSLAWFLFCALLGGSICVVLANYIGRFFEIPEELISDTRLALWLIGLRVVLCFPLNTFQGVLFAYQRYDLANLSKSVSIIFRFVGVILFFEFVSSGIVPLIVITIISLLLERVLWAWFSKSVAEDLHIKASLVSRRAIFALLSFGGFIVVIYTANIVGYEAVKWVIGSKLSVIDVGGYSLLAYLAVAGDGLVKSISTVLMPVASKYNALERHDTNVRLILLSTKYVMVVSSGLFLMPLLLLRPFLTLWVSDKYEPEYISLLAQAGIIVFLGQWFITMTACMLQILNGTGRVRVPALVTLSWAVGGVVSVWAYLHWGGNSLFVAVVVIMIARIIGAAAHMIYGLSVLKIRPGKMFIGSVLRPACAGVAVCVISRFLLSYFDVYKLATFVLVVIPLVITYFLLVWILVLTKSERTGTMNNVRSLIRNKSFAVQK